VLYTEGARVVSLAQIEAVVWTGEKCVYRVSDGWSIDLLFGRKVVVARAGDRRLFSCDDLLSALSQEEPTADELRAQALESAEGDVGFEEAYASGVYSKIPPAAEVAEVSL
jgi:hypothetical protein